MDTSIAQGSAGVVVEQMHNQLVDPYLEGCECDGMIQPGFVLTIHSSMVH